MFLEISVTIYDPQDRKLDLMKELSPFFVSGGIEWNNCVSNGIYVACGNYFIVKKMKSLGLKYVLDPREENENSDPFALMLFANIVIQNGYSFTEEEMSELKEMCGKNRQQIIIAPELPADPQFDNFRESFNRMRNVLELFKNRLN